jgi:hypothetical protein
MTGTIFFYFLHILLHEHTYIRCEYIHVQKEGLKEVLMNMTASGCT